MSWISGYIVVDSALIILVSLTLAFYLYQTKYFNYWKERNIPFIEPHWIFGSVKNEILKRKSWYEFSNVCYAMCKEKGIGGIFILRKPALVICKKDLVERILVKDFVHFQDRTNMSQNELMMKSLFMAKGERWKMMRYKLAPSFSSTKVKSMFEQILNCGDLITKRIYETSENAEPIRIEPLVFEYTTEVIASCAVGVQLLNNSEMGDRFRHTYKAINYFKPLKVIKFFLITLSPRLSKIMRFNLIDQSVNDFFTHLTEETIKYRENNHIRRNDFLQVLLDLKEQEFKAHFNKFSSSEEEIKISGFENSKTNPKDHIQSEIEPKKYENIFTDDVIVALIWNLLTSGLNPSLVTVNFAMFEIAKTRLIQTKVQDEIDSVLRKHKQVTYEALRDMTYLDQVVQETLRLHSFSSFLIRCVTEPYKIPEFNLTLEKDTLVYVPIAAMQQDPEHFTSPELFDPDRFEGNCYKSHPFFMPFGDGPRICISIKFALTIIKVCLVKIFKSYDVTVSDKMLMPVKYDIDVFYPKAKGGTWLNFKKREAEC